VRRTLLIGLSLAGLLATGWARVAPAAVASTDDAFARVRGRTVVLGDGQVRRQWRLPGGRRPNGLTTTALVDVATGRSWAGPASPDFAINVDGVSVTSQRGWRDVRATARTGHGVATVVIRMATLGVEIERTYTLFAGSATIGVRSVLRDKLPAPVRISAYTLDELTGPAGAAAVAEEVQTYHGGSDWRDDYRVASRPSGTFDVEGEVVRADDGRGRGAFIVAERRGGAMSRIGRDAGLARVWAGVDDGRDLLDAGPLLTDPPNYNRLENPLYPVPVRARTVPPLGTLELGTAHTGVYAGGASGAAAAFVTDFSAHGAPPYARSVGLNSFHPWNHGAAFNAATMLAQAKAGKAIGLETLMLDDQWQGGAGGESGDWQFDTVRFPDSDHDGTPDFVGQLHALGVGLGLWMSPVEFNGASTTWRAHPDWACAPVGDVTALVQDDAGLGVWDVTKPTVQNYLTSVIDRAVARWGVREFKFDFQAWLDCPPHDYLDYEDAFVALVHRFEARHPGVTFELDETNDQRAWPFESAAIGPSWFDNGHLHGSTAVAKLLHDIWTAAPWLPPSSIGTGLYDGTLKPPYTAGYLMPLGLLSHVTFWTDLTKLSRADAGETAWWIAWYKQHRAALSGLVYEDTTTDPRDGASTVVFQPWSGDRGYVFAFTQSRGGPIVAHLQGLIANRTYVLTDVRTDKRIGQATGAQLTMGASLQAKPYSARVIAVTPK
jgi:melibiase-like protein